MKTSNIISVSLLTLIVVKPQFESGENQHLNANLKDIDITYLIDIKKNKASILEIESKLNKNSNRDKKVLNMYKSSLYISLGLVNEAIKLFSTNDSNNNLKEEDILALSHEYWSIYISSNLITNFKDKITTYHNFIAKLINIVDTFKDDNVLTLLVLSLNDYINLLYGSFQIGITPFYIKLMKGYLNQIKIPNEYLKIALKFQEVSIQTDTYHFLNKKRILKTLDSNMDECLNLNRIDFYMLYLLRKIDILVEANKPNECLELINKAEGVIMENKVDNRLVGEMYIHKFFANEIAENSFATDKYLKSGIEHCLSIFGHSNVETCKLYQLIVQKFIAIGNLQEAKRYNDVVLRIAQTLTKKSNYNLLIGHLNSVYLGAKTDKFPEVLQKYSYFRKVNDEVMGDYYGNRILFQANYLLTRFKLKKVIEVYDKSDKNLVEV